MKLGAPRFHVDDHRGDHRSRKRIVAALKRAVQPLRQRLHFHRTEAAATIDQRYFLAVVVEAERIIYQRAAQT